MTSKLNHGYDPRVMIAFLHVCMLYLCNICVRNCIWDIGSHDFDTFKEADSYVFFMLKHA